MQKAVSTAARMKPQTQTFRILQNLSGSFKPGSITLLLGPPGAGKSILMRALSGGAPVATTGSVTFNGRALHHFNVVRTARYVGQRDVHNPSLTVRETLTFSAMCQGPGYNRGARGSTACMRGMRVRRAAATAGLCDLSSAVQDVPG